MNNNDILVVYGKDMKNMAKDVLKAAGIEDLIGDRCKRIGLKPNLVVARPAESGATTHPEIAAGVIEYLLEKGYKNLAVIEGSWVGDRTASAFRVCGYMDLQKKYGVELIDAQTDTYKTYNCGGIDIKICDSAMDVDFMINMPVMKGHCQTGVTCALKNNKGIIPNQEKRRFHTMGLHRPIAHLNAIAKNDFILVDAICGDLDFEEGGNPVPMNRIIGARDPVLCDSYVCELMGYDIEEVPYIRMAEELGAGHVISPGTNIVELNEAINTPGAFSAGRKAERLMRGIVVQDNACSACCGSLVRALQRLDEAVELGRIKGKLSIGQGFKGKTGENGIGSCTCRFARYVKGCPPKAVDILKFIREELRFDNM